MIDELAFETAPDVLLKQFFGVLSQGVFEPLFLMLI
jgi:hypothetical protein